MRKKKRFYKVFQYIALLCALIIIIFPVYWIIISSFKVKEDILSYPPKIFPSQFTLSNYITAFQDYNVLLYLKKSYCYLRNGYSDNYYCCAGGICNVLSENEGCPDIK